MTPGIRIVAVWASMGALAGMLSCWNADSTASPGRGLAGIVAGFAIGLALAYRRARRIRRRW